MSLLQSVPRRDAEPSPLPPPPPTGPITLELPRIGSRPHARERRRSSTGGRNASGALNTTGSLRLESIWAGARAGQTMLDSTTAITPGDAWQLYLRAFGPRRRPEASSRPDLSREGFEALMDDQRVSKLVVIDQATERAVGLATVSSDLSTAPVSVGRALRERWPALVADGRIWYVSLLLVDPEQLDSGTTTHLLGGIWARAAAGGGLAAVDTSGVSDASMNVPTALFQLAREFAPRTTLQHLDDPRFWAYEFPTPQPR